MEGTADLLAPRGEPQKEILPSLNAVRQHVIVDDVVQFATDVQRDGNQKDNVHSSDVKLKISFNFKEESNEESFDKSKETQEMEREASRLPLNCASNDRVVDSSHVISSDTIRHRLIQTACLCSCMLALGLIAAVAGTTLVHISQLYGSTPGRVSWALMLEGAGCLVGTFVCRLLVDRASVELTSSSCIVAASMFTLLAPFTPSLFLFVGVIALRGVAIGCFVLVSQTFVVAAWSGHRYREPLTQTQQAVWSIGATLSPFIIRPFLVELQTYNGNVHLNTSSNGSVFEQGLTTTYYGDIQLQSTILANKTLYHHFNAHWRNTSVYGIVNGDVTGDVTTSAATASTGLMEGLQSTRYAYVAIGILSMMTSLPTICLLLYEQVRPCFDESKKSSVRSKERSKNAAQLTDNSVDDGDRSSVPGTSSVSQVKTSMLVSVSYIAVVVVSNFFYGGLEIIGRTFLTPFVIRELTWPVADAVLQASVFFAMFTAGRLLGIPISTKIRPMAMLVIDILVVSAGFGFLLLVKTRGSWIVWMSSALVAIGLSTGFPALVLISAAGPEMQFIGGSGSSSQTTARVLQAMMIGGHLGCSVFPVAVGYLFDNVSPMWVIYMPLIIAVFVGLLMILKQVLAKFILRLRY